MFSVYHYVVCSLTWMLCCSYAVTRVEGLADMVYKNVLFLVIAAWIITVCRNRVELKCRQLSHRSVMWYLLLFSTFTGAVFANGVIVLAPYVPLVAALASIALVYAVAVAGRLQLKKRRIVLVGGMLCICVLAVFIARFLLAADSFSTTITVMLLLYQSFVMYRSQQYMQRMLADETMKQESRSAVCAFILVSNIFLVYPEIYAINEEK